jgi:hypothetical protein
MQATAHAVLNPSSRAGVQQAERLPASASLGPGREVPAMRRKWLLAAPAVALAAAAAIAWPRMHARGYS